MPSRKRTEETMGARLKRLRESANMSQEALAREAGVSLGAVRNWEQDRRVPMLDAAARVAAALSITLDDLADCILPKRKGKR
jgi:transcriptional regulator with XRE-family HTH domain